MDNKFKTDNTFHLNKTQKQVTRDTEMASHRGNIDVCIMYTGNVFKMSLLSSLAPNVRVIKAKLCQNNELPNCSHLFF